MIIVIYFFHKSSYTNLHLHFKRLAFANQYTISKKKFQILIKTGNIILSQKQKSILCFKHVRLIMLVLHNNLILKF